MPFHFLDLAVAEAQKYRGATAPNPPVGAAAIDRDGNFLGVEAHHRAGAPHAEARLLKDLDKRNILNRVDHLFVTLEPCNHLGRTPPCTQAILDAKIPKVTIGGLDPNPHVAGQGLQRLLDAGVRAQFLEHAPSYELNAPFFQFIVHGLPWVTIKTVERWDPKKEQWTSIPPAGKTTFSSATSLDLAHELRRRSDAILTGSGTILADNPFFTVRRVKDHAWRAKKNERILVYLDRRGRVPQGWIERQKSLGFKVFSLDSLEKSFDFLNQQGVLEVLVEAGPQLSQALLKKGWWNEHYQIRCPNVENGSDGADVPDQIKREVNPKPCLPGL